MTIAAPVFRTRLAQSAADLRAAQRLRYKVFVAELGATGALIDHTAQIEADRFDAVADHLLLEDLSRPGDPVIGTYRLMGRAQAERAGRFSSANEFELDPLLRCDRPLLELGRSCLLPAYRGGPAMMHLFAGLAGVIAKAPQTLMFGVASFHGTDARALTVPLRYLHRNHPAPHALRVRAKGPLAVAVANGEVVDKKTALQAIPPLIKAYLRLGGVVGDGACIDPAFNTTDVCMILDTAAMTQTQRNRLAAPRALQGRIL